MNDYQKIYLKGIVITLLIIVVIAFPFMFSIKIVYTPNDAIADTPSVILFRGVPNYRWIQYSLQLILGIIATIIASKLFAIQMVKRPNQLFINNLLSTIVLWICFMFVGVLDDVFGKSFPIDLGSIIIGWLVFGGILFLIISLFHTIILYPILRYLRNKLLKRSGKP